jgi:hypothetical protein
MGFGHSNLAHGLQNIFFQYCYTAELRRRIQGKYFQIVSPKRFSAKKEIEVTKSPLLFFMFGRATPKRLGMAV